MDLRNTTHYYTFVVIMRYTTVLTIAGSDSGGGAGIQADIKTISAIGCYSASAITAITAQNTCGVNAIQTLSPQIVKEQIESVATDIEIDAIKIGMVSEPDIIEVISDFIKDINNIPIVFDPVLVSTSGHILTQSNTIDLITTQIIPYCTLVTPNIFEAERLTNISISTEEDMINACYEIQRYGCQNVLIKGGHSNSDIITDILISKDKIFKFSATKILSQNTHGTGCTLSSAIASYLALGNTLPDAVEKGKTFITNAIKSGKDVKTGKGHGPVNHFFKPIKMIIK